MLRAIVPIQSMSCLYRNEMNSVMPHIHKYRTNIRNKMKKNKTRRVVRSPLTSSLHYSIVRATMAIENKESRPLGKFPHTFFA